MAHRSWVVIRVGAAGQLVQALQQIVYRAASTGLLRIGLPAEFEHSSKKQNSGAPSSYSFGKWRMSVASRSSRPRLSEILTRPTHQADSRSRPAGRPARNSRGRIVPADLHQAPGPDVAHLPIGARKRFRRRFGTPPPILPISRILRDRAARACAYTRKSRNLP